MFKAAVALAIGLAASPALAQSVITQDSKFSVKETLDRLTAALEKRGVKVVARIDHAANATAAGTTLPPTEVVLFANPQAGTPLMQSNPLIGLDLPMKVLAWEDKAGKVRLSYAPPAELKRRYAITDRDQVFAKIEAAMAELTKDAAGN